MEKEREGKGAGCVSKKVGWEDWVGYLRFEHVCTLKIKETMEDKEEWGYGQRGTILCKDKSVF